MNYNNEWLGWSGEHITHPIVASLSRSRKRNFSSITEEGTLDRFAGKATTFQEHVHHVFTVWHHVTDTVPSVEQMNAILPSLNLVLKEFPEVYKLVCCCAHNCPLLQSEASVPRFFWNKCLAATRRLSKQEYGWLCKLVWIKAVCIRNSLNK